MKKDKIVKDIKLYNLIMSNIWQLLTTILFGVLVGYLLNRYAEKENNHYMLFSIIVFFIIGIINFFVAIIRGSKKLAIKEANNQKVIQTYEQSDEVADDQSNG